VGTVTIDANLSDWTPADLIDETLSVAGYDIYGKATGGSLVLAMQAPVAIGPHTTAWLNTDNNSATGFQIFGFTGGAEFNINFDVAGVPHLYTGNAGQTLVSSADITYRLSADGRTLEMAVPLSAIGSPGTVSTLWDVNDSVFLPTSFSLTQYQIVTAPPSSVVGTVTIDGSLAEWTAADHIDQTLSVGGYDIYARATGGSYVFAIDAPVEIGVNTTAWLNTDQNASTGFQIFGFAGGAEFNINFDNTGTPRLYTGNSGQTLVSGATVQYAYSPDHTTVEFSVQSSAIGSPDAINTLWDVNDVTFLPTSFMATQYPVVDVAAPTPTAGSITLDGDLEEWTLAEQMDTALSVAGYDIYGRVTGGSLVFALDGGNTEIGAHTTAWLNTDANTATGFQVFGFGAGAEFNINFDASGAPHLYSGNAGQTLQLSDVLYGYSADHTKVEFAVPLAAIGSPATVQTSWDVNDSVFLPIDFSLVQYAINTTTGALSVVDV
jgi:serralysin